MKNKPVCCAIAVFLAAQAMYGGEDYRLNLRSDDLQIPELSIFENVDPAALPDVNSEDLHYSERLFAESGAEMQSAAAEVSQDTSAREGVEFTILPYPFYTNVFKFAVGAFASLKGFPQESSFLKVGGFVSTNGSILGYLQYEELQIPYFERIAIRPDLFFGKIGKIRNYSEMPYPFNYIIPQEDYPVTAGTNGSDIDDYFEIEGTYQWYEGTLSYLLPIGWGKDHITTKPILEDGILMGGETGGYSLNPFKSGRTFLKALVSYRRLDMEYIGYDITQIASGVEWIFNVENLDYIWNPTRGYNFNFSYFMDWSALGGTSKFDVLKADISAYVPLSEPRDKTPTVLAFNFKTAHTLSWDKYDIVSMNVGGHQFPETKEYHRPPNFIGAFLGGPIKMRGYPEYRFYDRSSIYYSMEYRQITDWNPLNSFKLTRGIVDWFEYAFFGELGRVAPDWNFVDFHKDMKWDIGAGLRIFMNGFLVRVDLSYGGEGFLVQMYYNYPF